MRLNERECWFWLSSCDWIGHKSAERLLGYFKSARNIYYGTDSHYEKIKGLNPKLLTHLKTKKQSEDEIRRSIEKMNSQGGQFTCRFDINYPERLRQIPDPPLGIFYYGSLPDPAKPMIAVIGIELNK